MKDLKENESTNKFTRRKFLGTIGIGSAGLLTLPFLKLSNVFGSSFQKQTQYLAQVGIAKATTYDTTLIKNKVQSLFEAIGGISDIVGSGKKVAIKINLTGGSDSATSPLLKGRSITEAMWTHPEVLRAVGQLLIDSGVSPNNIYIVEALWDAASYNKFGYKDVQTSLGVQMVDLNYPAPYSSFITKSTGPNYYYFSSFQMNQILADIDVYVSIPKMKQHLEAGVTGSIKNQIGSVPKTLYQIPTDSGRRGMLHTGDGTISSTIHLPRTIFDLSLVNPVNLAVIDGVLNSHGGEGVWAGSTFSIASDNVLIAGKNPVATDSVMAYLLGNDPQASKFNLPTGGQCDNYLDLLHQKGSGTNQMNEIQILGDGAGLVTSVMVNNDVNLPVEYGLYPNFPNPFNPSTTLKFNMPSTNNVSVKIYSITGQEIETLVNGEVSKGIHEVRWSPKGVSSGVYICVMQSDGYKNSIKMIYQK
jgi:uncharacterized protein (DUF362 family)